MDGKTFRKMADYAADQVAKMLDEFPECPACTIRMRGKFGVIVVGIEDIEQDDDDE